jgi:hypothetical protein
MTFFVQRSHLNYNYKIRPISDGYFQLGIRIGVGRLLVGGEDNIVSRLGQIECMRVKRFVLVKHIELQECIMVMGQG